MRTSSSHRSSFGQLGLSLVAAVLFAALVSGCDGDDETNSQEEPSTPVQSTSLTVESESPSAVTAPPSETPSSEPAPPGAVLNLPDDIATTAEDTLTCQLLTPGLAATFADGLSVNAGAPLSGVAFPSCTYSRGEDATVQLTLDRLTEPDTWASDLRTALAGTDPVDGSVVDTPSGLGDEGFILTVNTSAGAYKTILWRSGSYAFTFLVTAGGMEGPSETTMLDVSNQIYQAALARSA